MKTKLFFIALTSAMLSMPAMAQEVKQADANQPKMEKRAHRARNTNAKVDREKLKQARVDGMVNALMLDDATTAKFKPAYEKYLKELGEARAINKPKEKPAKDAVRTAPTDAQILQRIEKDFARKQKVLDVREKYYKEFKKYLTPKQLLKVFHMEKGKQAKFRKEARKDYRWKEVSAKPRRDFKRPDMNAKGNAVKNTQETN